MAHREKMSYRVYKRILEIYIRPKCDLLGLHPILSQVRDSIFGKESDVTALPILIDTLLIIQYSSIETEAILHRLIL
jgi:hypothetical protein